jgi:hypothetical protein
MAEYSIGPINIEGYRGKAVPNRLFRNVGPANGLAVIFPGLRYTCDMPLLFYPTKLLLGKGFDILQLQVDYTDDTFAKNSPDRQIDWLGEDARGAVQAGLGQRDYPHLVLLGKSIGTLAMSVLLLNQPELNSHVTIWLTPLFRLPLVEQATQQLKAPALFVGGTGDNTFDAARLAHLENVIQAQSLVYEDADHSLEVSGNLPRSLDILQEMVTSLSDFVDRATFA